jgi:transcriptional regulator
MAAEKENMRREDRGQSEERIGGRIRELRRRNGVSQEKLARLLHFENKATISSYETERRAVPTDVVIQLAEIFNTTTDYILCGRYPETDVTGQNSELRELTEVLLTLKTCTGRKAALEHMRTLLAFEREMLKQKLE